MVIFVSRLSPVCFPRALIAISLVVFFLATDQPIAGQEDPTHAEQDPPTAVQDPTTATTDTTKAAEPTKAAAPLTLNQKAGGYRGIWYMNQPSDDEYVYKYSGGLGTYCAKHRPFAIYCKSVNKTFFCYGGAPEDNDRKLLHMVSCFDHATGEVPLPTIVLDKQTDDAHDNPVISIDGDGYIWIFSTSHGRARPSYIHRSKQPYDIDGFDLVPATWLTDDGEQPFDNFSYMQVWNTKANGFSAFFTKYGDPVPRTIGFMKTVDGKAWGRWQRVAAMDAGHYQISGSGRDKLGTMFNYHPEGKGLNWRTNLYYVETKDNGETWQTIDGQTMELPLVQPDCAALVRDYESDLLNVYLKDIQFDQDGHPVLLYITSKGYQAGPENDPRTWTIAKWTGEAWSFSEITHSDNNYDFGELWIKGENDWRVTAPTEPGPQAFNPGGEIAMWVSTDQGETWQMEKQLTLASQRNHTYVRNVRNAHNDFVSIWADGHGRQPSDSKLYFADAEGNVFQLPQQMDQPWAKPIRLELNH